jgi:PhzF family phenazine biosynthesis protein
MAGPPHTHRMKKRDFLQLDVFASEPGRGNPLAVVLGAAALDGATMQAIAGWLNLSETTFVLPPTQVGADYRLRIFTPRQELPFAGHPSVGTAHAVLERGLVTPREGHLVQECGAGLLPIRVDGEGRQRRLHVRAPRGVERAADPVAILSSLRTERLGALRPVIIDNGPRWWCIELADEAAVRALVPDLQAMAKASVATNAVGVAVFARCPGPSYALVVRAFVPADGIPEDPVTGSANAAIAAWLHANGALPAQSFLSSQGREVGRDGIVECAVDTDGDVWIGGQTQTVIEGVLHW